MALISSTQFVAVVIADEPLIKISKSLTDITDPSIIYIYKLTENTTALPDSPVSIEYIKNVDSIFITFHCNSFPIVITHDESEYKFVEWINMHDIYNASGDISKMLGITFLSAMCDKNKDKKLRFEISQIKEEHPFPIRAIILNQDGQYYSYFVLNNSKRNNLVLKQQITDISASYSTFTIENQQSIPALGNKHQFENMLSHPSPVIPKSAKIENEVKANLVPSPSSFAFGKPIKKEEEKVAFVQPFEEEKEKKKDEADIIADNVKRIEGFINEIKERMKIHLLNPLMKSMETTLAYYKKIIEERSQLKKSFQVVMQHVSQVMFENQDLVIKEQALLQMCEQCKQAYNDKITSRIILLKDRIQNISHSLEDHIQDMSHINKNNKQAALYGVSKMLRKISDIVQQLQHRKPCKAEPKKSNVFKVPVVDTKSPLSQVRDYNNEKLLKQLKTFKIESNTTIVNPVSLQPSTAELTQYPIDNNILEQISIASEETKIQRHNSPKKKETDAPKPENQKHKKFNKFTVPAAKPKTVIEESKASIPNSSLGQSFLFKNNSVAKDETKNTIFFDTSKLPEPSNVKPVQTNENADSNKAKYSLEIEKNDHPIHSQSNSIQKPLFFDTQANKDNPIVDMFGSSKKESGGLIIGKKESAKKEDKPKDIFSDPQNSIFAFNTEKKEEQPKDASNATIINPFFGSKANTKKVEAAKETTSLFSNEKVLIGTNVSMFDKVAENTAVPNMFSSQANPFGDNKKEEKAKDGSNGFPSIFQFNAPQSSNSGGISFGKPSLNMPTNQPQNVPQNSGMFSNSLFGGGMYNANPLASFSSNMVAF